MNIGLYIHIPFCGAKCPYCDFASFKSDKSVLTDLSIQKKYVDALKKEIQKRCGKIEYTAETVFIGGGTPSVLYRGGLTEIIDAIKSCMNFAPSEFTVEANPESADNDFLNECVSLGVNRLSLGLQSAEDGLLKGLRRHNFQDFLSAVESAKNAGIENINADLMLGLPNQTSFDVENSIDKLIELRLKHISVYALKVEDGTPLFKSGFSPDDDKAADFYDIAMQKLKQNGYRRYEVSNFTVPDFECRHNQKYWDLSPYLGVGLNAASFLNGLRTVNTREFDKYLKGEFEFYCEDAGENFLTEYIMLGLRTSRGISKTVLSRNGFDFSKNAFKKHLDNGVLIVDGDNIILDEKYFFIMNSIISDLI